MPDPTAPLRFASALRRLRAKDLLVISLLAAAMLLLRAGDGAEAKGHTAAWPPSAAPVQPGAPEHRVAPVVPLPLVTAVAMPRYAPGSAERAVFDALNDARSRGNFGLLAQDSRLDAAAAAHAAYMALNLAGGISHRQVAERPGFSGETPIERVRAAGYDTSLNFEAISSGTTATACLELLNTVYHLGVLMIGATDVGIAVDPGAGCVIEAQLPRGAPAMQARPAGALGVYPYPGQTGVPPAFMPATEVPNPAPDLGDALAGPPILVDLEPVPSGGGVVLNRFSLAEAAGGRPVEARVLARPGVQAAPGAEIDLRVDRRLASAGQVFLLPLRPLRPATAYAIDFSGSANGVAVSRRWAFTTR